MYSFLYGCVVGKEEALDPVGVDPGRWGWWVSLPVGLPYFYEAAGVWAVLVLVCLAPCVDHVDVFGGEGFFTVVAFGFVYRFHGVTCPVWIV